MTDQTSSNVYLKGLRENTPAPGGKMGISQTQASILLGVTLRTYQRWEANDIEAPRMAIVLMEMMRNDELPKKYLPW